MLLAPLIAAFTALPLTALEPHFESDISLDNYASGYGDERVCPAAAARMPEHAPHLAADGSDCHAIVAFFGAENVGGLTDLQAHLPRECLIRVYDKTEEDACAFMPVEGVADCTVMPNNGREQHTYAEHVRRNYHSLPTWLIFLPVPMDRHSRIHSLQKMLNASVLNPSGEGLEGEGFSCIDRTPGERCDGGRLESRGNLTAYKDCRMLRYAPEGAGEASKAEPASPAGLYNWFEAHAPNSTDFLCHMPACHFGVIITTAANVRAHPLAVYEDVAAALNSSQLNEPIWYMEWGAAALWGMRAASAKLAANGACKKITPSTLHAPGYSCAVAGSRGAFYNPVPVAKSASDQHVASRRSAR